MWKKIWESKWFYVLLSVILAVVLWNYVVREVNADKSGTIRGIPVSFSGTEILASRNLIISEGDTQTIDLEVQTKMNTYAALNQETILLTVQSTELSRITGPGAYRLPVKIDYSPSVPNYNSIVVSNADALFVNITVSKLEDKSVPVRGEFTGSVAEGYQVGEFDITPASISISGQSELVNQVAYVKVVLNVQGLDETYTGDLPFIYVGPDGQELANLNVTANVDRIHVVLPVVKSKQVPLAVDFIAGGGATEKNAQVEFYRTSDVGKEDAVPITYIDVTGPEEELEGLNKIVLGEIDLSQVLLPETEFDFHLELGEGFSNESGYTDITAKVTLTGLVTREFNVDNIERINIPEGYTAELVSQTRQVMVRGPQEAVDAVFAGQLRIVVDLSAAQLAAGRQTVPVKVYLDGASSVGVVGDYNVVVILTPEE